MQKLFFQKFKINFLITTVITFFLFTVNIFSYHNDFNTYDSEKQEQKN
jgi:hypothetical protein